MFQSPLNGVPANSTAGGATNPPLPLFIRRLILGGQASVALEKSHAMEEWGEQFEAVKDAVIASVPREVHGYIDWREGAFRANATEHFVTIRVPGLASIVGKWRRESVESRAWEQVDWHEDRGEAGATGATAAAKDRTPWLVATAGPRRPWSQSRYARTLERAFYWAWDIQQQADAAQAATAQIAGRDPVAFLIHPVEIPQATPGDKRDADATPDNGHGDNNTRERPRMGDLAAEAVRQDVDRRGILPSEWAAFMSQHLAAQCRTEQYLRSLSETMIRAMLDIANAAEFVRQQKAGLHTAPTPVPTMPTQTPTPFVVPDMRPMCSTGSNLPINLDLTTVRSAAVHAAQAAFGDLNVASQQDDAA